MPYPAAERDEFGVRIVLCPLPRIYVSSNSSGRGNSSQSFDHFWCADVPSVDDVVGPYEMLYRLGAQKTVRIGDNADPHHCACVTHRLCGPSIRLRLAFISAFPLSVQPLDMISIRFLNGGHPMAPIGPRKPFQPDDRPTVTPRIITDDVDGMVEFLRSVFGALGEVRSGAPAEMKIGDSIVMVSDGGGVRQVFPAFLYVYVESADAAYQRAIVSGARSIEEPKETPYGDRRATVQDQWGNMWQIATYRSASA